MSFLGKSEKWKVKSEQWRLVIGCAIWIAMDEWWRLKMVVCCFGWKVETGGGGGGAGKFKSCDPRSAGDRVDFEGPKASNFS